MWTFFRVKSRWPARVPVVLAGLALVAGCATRAPLQESLYTPVREGQAIGPMPPPPVAYYPYEPTVIRALAEVPLPVREAAVAHVQARVGDEFYGRLRFVGGQAIDLAELHRVNPESRRFQPEVAAWLLRFDFALPEAGIHRYTASVALRSDGTVLRSVDLPAFAREPDKLRLKPLAEVSAALARKGRIDPATTTATVTYDALRDTLVWHFEQTLPGTSAEVKTRVVDVDARTSEEIRSAGASR